MTFLSSMDDVMDYLKQDNRDPVIMVFYSPNEYYDFLKKHDTFFKKYYDFNERMTESQVHHYNPFAIRLEAGVERITDRMNSWAYCSLRYYKENGYRVFARYSELNSSRQITSATEQEINDFLFVK